MDSDKTRLLLFIWLSMLVFLFWTMYNTPKPKAKAPVDVAAQLEDDAEEPGSLEAKPGDEKKVAVEEKPVELADSIVMGTEKSGPDSPYYAQTILTNRGAGVRELFLNRYKSEHRTDRLRALSDEETPSASYLLAIAKDKSLMTKNWEVESAAEDKVVFKTISTKTGVEVRKIFTMPKGEKATHLTLEFTNKSDKPIEHFHYRLQGGHGVPIEGAWYTQTFRSAVFVLQPTDRATPKVVQELSSAIVKKHDDEEPQVIFSTTPVKFAGVGTQYFASLVLQPQDVTKTNYFDEAIATFLSRGKKPELSDVGVELRSRDFSLAPGQTVSDELLLYNGPKEESTLQSFPADYHLHLVNHAPTFMYMDISWIAHGMLFILHFFLGIFKDYGLAIIGLTVVVRLFLYPLTYKQNMGMMKMQAVQPLMQKLKEECGDDKQLFQEKMMELYRRHKVNPFAGCFPIFLQLPIFVGLWQTLQHSFELRQAPFLFGWTWIDDLSAPDQLFKFPFNIDFVNSWFGPYFNLLPIVATAQIILQMKYMSPPPASEEMRLQQRMMMIMMAFMSVLFYKVPSGLCIYIVTSGLWGLIERKLMPKPKMPKIDEEAVAAIKASSNGASWKKPIDEKKKNKR